MTRFIVLIALSALLLAPASGASFAADVALQTAPARVYQPPFPRSERSQSVWASNVCWSECGSFTAWNEVACLERDAQGACLKHADSADRSCQRQCRSSGGPLLPLDF